jgi:hypothetical protein
MMDQGKHLEWEGKYHSSKKKIYDCYLRFTLLLISESVRLIEVRAN